VSRSRVERIWKLEGLKVPQKQPKRGCDLPAFFGPSITREDQNLDALIILLFHRILKRSRCLTSKKGLYYETCFGAPSKPRRS
jgi:hypothetical protein